VCRMFGFRSSVPSRAHRSLLEAENALAAQSVGHPDGWGIGWFVGDDAYVAKSGASAHACERFSRTSQRLASHTFVVHVRRATVGVVDSLNAHPFRFGRWLFAHNGTLFDMDRMRPWLAERTPSSFESQILGDTDSEALFFWLLGRLEAAGIDPHGRDQPDASVTAGAVREALLELDAVSVELGVMRPLLNVLLTDGRSMVGHRAGMPLHLSTQKAHCPDAQTCTALKVCLERVRPPGHPVNHILLASERIGVGENLWEEVEDGATVVLSPDMHLSITEPPKGWVAPVMPEHLRVQAAPSLAVS